MTLGVAASASHGSLSYAEVNTYIVSPSHLFRGCTVVPEYAGAPLQSEDLKEFRMNVTSLDVALYDWKMLFDEDVGLPCGSLPPIQDPKADDSVRCASPAQLLPQ